MGNTVLKHTRMAYIYKFSQIILVECKNCLISICVKFCYLQTNSSNLLPKDF